jgi:pyridoxine 5-phosphate synthase
MGRAQLSVNVNKYALLRNSRGHDTPSLRWAVDEVLAAGAHGITVHPRMDQRHVRFDDVPAIASHLRDQHAGVELNVECENHPYLIDLVCDVGAAQCTLVPVRPGEVTSDHGYAFPDDAPGLAPTVERLKARGIRVSIFMDCERESMIDAARVGVDRVELYTGPYAWAWGTADQAKETARIWAAAQSAVDAGLELNAGHDLDSHNLAGLVGLPGLKEVSIGHAQIVRALAVGTRQSVGELLAALGW